MSQAVYSGFVILVDSGVPHCVTGSLWFGFISRTNCRCFPPSHRLTEATVSGLWPLNTATADRGLSLSSDWAHRRRQQCHHRERGAGWVLYGWLGGNKLGAGCAEPWTQHSHPTHSGWAWSGPLCLDGDPHRAANNACWRFRESAQVVKVY